MSTNGINVELRPGLKIVRTVSGNRETIWVEEDHIVSSASGRSFRGFLVIIFIVSLYIIFAALNSESIADNQEQGHTKIENVNR